MRRFFRLAQLEFRGQAYMLFATLFLMSVLETILFMLMRATAGADVTVRFEGLIDRSGVAVVFVCALAVVLAIEVWGLVRGFAPTKSIYALLTLPISRRRVFFSKMCIAMISIMCLWCTQFSLVLFFHGAYTAKFAASMPRGSLYLSFFRSPFLRTVFPLHPIAALTSLLAMYVLAAFVMVFSVSIRSRKRWLLFVWTLWLSHYATRMYPMMTHGPEVGFLQLGLVMLIAVGICALGIQSLERGEVSV